MKSFVTAQYFKNAQMNSIASILNSAGVFSGGNPASGIAKGWEIITQPIRDYQTYPTAGFRTLMFFQAQAGSPGTTLDNQNMPGAGLFPRGQMFLAEGIEVDFRPAGAPGTTQNVEAGANDFEPTNDQYNVTRAGYLTLTIGARPYLNVGPLAQFPPSFRVNGAFALSDASTAAASQLSIAQYVYNQGEPFSMIPVLLMESVNFNVTLNYTTPIAVANAGTIGVNLNGTLLRRNQ